MSRACQFQDDHLNEPPCGKQAIFSVLRHDFDPVRPDPDRDNRDCCRDHLPVTVEMTDEDEPGYVVHVTVIASVLDRRAAEEALS